MSEKEKELLLEEEEEEEVILDHWRHEHLLTLVEIRTRVSCFGCCRLFSSGEEAYGCIKKCRYFYLHQECAEMGRKIRHPTHPQHILIQQIYHHESRRCAICERYINALMYICSISKCKFWLCPECAQDIATTDATDDDEQNDVVQHPSHPQHELRLWRRCSFRCDACGTTRKGSFYLCVVCQYRIHQRCASLHDAIKREDHHHQLSLSFRLPLEYIDFNYKCDVCHKDLMHKYWIYHCQLCRYAVHVRCAFKKSPDTTTNNANASNVKDIIRFPINDVAEEQITPFVLREGGTIAPVPGDDDENINAKYKFHYHKHQLTLISTSSSHDSQNGEEDEENSDDDEEDHKEEIIICDACTNPIFQKKHTPSSSSSSSSSNTCYYMSCSECKYFLHWACFHLPLRLPSIPLHHKARHELILQPCPKLEFWKICNVCTTDTNGMFYSCTGCIFIVDIKCASLPDTIHHASHPQHLLKLLTKEVALNNYTWRTCSAGCVYPAAGGSDCYVCGSCEFVLHVTCVLLPESATDRIWDKHPLPLTYDANVDHPSEFYCEGCEEQMNPKMWMYHCRSCDASFHGRCLPAVSGDCRNMKFGQQYLMSAAHPHPLSYQLLTTKRRCDVCRALVYNHRGFQCASCNFSLCLYVCGSRLLQDTHIQVVD